MKPDDLLLPLDMKPTQVYMGKGLHTLGLIEWILRQAGTASITVSTFSTSIDFLSGFFNLRKRGLVSHAALIVDVKAARKTMKLNTLMRSAFDSVHMAENHSKVVTVLGEKMKVSVISSMNNTYGGRTECTAVTTMPDIYETLERGLRELADGSMTVIE